LTESTTSSGSVGHRPDIGAKEISEAKSPNPIFGVFRGQIAYWQALLRTGITDTGYSSIRAIRGIRGSSNPFPRFMFIRVNSSLRFISYTLALRVTPAAASLPLLRLTEYLQASPMRE
jgi:hypothetical protein